jgi:hypothetical protein
MLCALAAVTLILPAMAYAGTDKGRGNDDQNNGEQKDRGIRKSGANQRTRMTLRFDLD